MREAASTIYTDYQDQLKAWLNEYGFTHAITLSSLSRSAKTYLIGEKLRKWARDLEKHAKIQVGYMGVYNKNRIPTVIF